MKLLWLCNMMPGAVQEKLGGKKRSGLWVDHVLSGLRQQGLEMRILCPGGAAQSGRLDDSCSFSTFAEGAPYRYLPRLDAFFREELTAFRPDVIHVWGTEYGHTLAMMNAVSSLNLDSRTVVSIQGLCSVYAGHYAEGVPVWVQRRFTFRDFLRQDSIALQRRKFALRGELEIRALEKARHVIGRTDWDRACTLRINPEAEYHFCNETLREPFYDGKWQYESCRKHRIFASSCAYPVKGFHYLLEAFAEVVKVYPDAALAVPGKSFLPGGVKDRLRQGSYQKYLAALARRYGVENRIEFLGSLSAEQMKASYLSANVFVLPSTIENSPNSLGEAMLLGVPCVAADVGGVTTLMEHNREGLVYQSTAPYMLAYDIQRVFALEDRAEALGEAARLHAQKTHSPEANLRDLLEIYRAIAE